MEKLKELNLTQLSRGEMKKVAGGTETCEQRANGCISGLACKVSNYGTFATCIGTDIIGCSPLREFGILCPNPQP